MEGYVCLFLILGIENSHYFISPSFFFTDIKIKYLLVFEDRLPYLFRLFVVWLSFNSIVFGLLYIASERILGEAPLC